VFEEEAPVTIERALISVYDKTGIVEFARALDALAIKSFPREARRACCAKQASACAT